MGSDKKTVYAFIGYSYLNAEKIGSLIFEQLAALGIHVKRNHISKMHLQMHGLEPSMDDGSIVPMSVELTEHMICNQFSLDKISKDSSEAPGKTTQKLRPPINTGCSVPFSQLRISVCGTANTGKTVLMNYIEHVLKSSSDTKVSECRSIMLDPGQVAFDPIKLENWLGELATRVQVQLVLYPLRRSQFFDVENWGIQPAVAEEA